MGNASHTIVQVEHNPFADEQQPVPQPAPAINLDFVPELMMQMQQAFVMTLEQQGRLTRDQIASMLQHEEQMTRELVNAITTPKTIVHDKAGRPVGVK